MCASSYVVGSFGFLAEIFLATDFLGRKCYCFDVENIETAH